MKDLITKVAQKVPVTLQKLAEAERMENLLARLESAEEGSRELDAHVKTLKSGGTHFRWTTSMGGTYYEAFTPDGESLWHVHQDDIPHYTTNLQDALSLVPEGWDWFLSKHIAVLVLEKNGVTQDECPIEAPTPALALCIAALKAMRHGS